MVARPGDTGTRKRVSGTMNSPLPCVAGTIQGRGRVLARPEGGPAARGPAPIWHCPHVAVLTSNSFFFSGSFSLL